MGMLVDGVWQDEDLKKFTRDGVNVRFDAGFHHVIEDRAGSQYPAEPGRYALYFNRTCPWSHRGVLTRALKGLEDVVDAVLLDPVRGPQSWWFGSDGTFRDPALSATHLHQLYSASNNSFTGRVSIPVLWDKQTETIVSNDSAAIARMFNSEFNRFAERPELDYYPAARRSLIDAWNDRVADKIADGVYRCLLAASQEEYETAFDELFAELDAMETHLTGHRYLTGNTPTEPDWRLFACLVRFDAVYYPMYGCNLRRIVDYPNLWAYTRDLYQLPHVAGTVDMEALKKGYYGIIRPGRPVPKGPALDFTAAHNRA